MFFLVHKNDIDNSLPLAPSDLQIRWGKGDKGTDKI